MLGAAAGKAKRAVGLTFPTGRSWVRAAVAMADLMYRVRGLRFRAYVHPPEPMMELLVRAGLTMVDDHTGPSWRTVVFRRV